MAAVDQPDEQDAAPSTQATPKKVLKRKTKGSRTSPRIRSTKVSEPIVLQDDDTQADEDDTKSTHPDETGDDDTGEQVGTYNYLLASSTNTARTLQLYDTSHARALLNPRSAPCFAPSVASTSDWSLVSEAIRQAEAFDDDESPDSIAALLRMIAKYSDVKAQAKDVFKASRLVHLASEEYTPPPDALAITVTKSIPDFVNAWWREFAQKDLAGPEPRQQNGGPYSR